MATRTTDVSAFLELVAGRRGHFQLESGYHGALRLDLDTLFADPTAVEPFVAALAHQIAPYRPDVICGPLLGGALLAQRVAIAVGAQFCYTEREASGDSRELFQARYRLPKGFHDRVRGQRVAIVDDVMSAGSASRGTFEELRAFGAETVVVGALLILGDIGANFFGSASIPVAQAARDDYRMWTPDACPLCAQGVPLEAVTD